ncbi:hypothetical protein OJAV_G00078270 [Oryzias javanicus]|uniref:Uncharacterized protein n=1 Tax=Oryzias javanicus TaxID=123683 RepID=A0A437D2Y0_ORYJA|nr:hypothetical protein OJAV_G00078270 [Oryzias javanicus]
MHGMWDCLGQKSQIRWKNTETNNLLIDELHVYSWSTGDQHGHHSAPLLNGQCHPGHGGHSGAGHLLHPGAGSGLLVYVEDKAQHRGRLLPGREKYDLVACWGFTVCQ